MGTAAVVLTTVGASSMMTHLDAYVVVREAILTSAAILTALIAFFKPSEMADRYRLAWATLGNAIDQFIFGSDDIDKGLEAVRSACLWGESVIRNNAPVALDKEWSERDRRREQQQAEQDIQEAQQAEDAALERKADVESKLKDIGSRKEAATKKEDEAKAAKQQKGASEDDRKRADTAESEAKNEREGYEKQESELKEQMVDAHRDAARAARRTARAKAKVNNDK
jgi:hypothetical protein